MAIVRAYSFNITTNDIEPGAVTEPKIDLSSPDSTNLVLSTTGTAVNKPPEVTFNRKSTTVADDMDIGRLSFRGQNSTPEEIEYAQILVQSSDVTDADEAGEIIISAYSGGRVGVAALKECLVIGMESTDPAARGFALQINRQHDSDLDFIVRARQTPTCSAPSALLIRRVSAAHQTAQSVLCSRFRQPHPLPFLPHG